MGYERLSQEALRGVVRAALERVARDGLPGDHHFYITFRTDLRGTEVPLYLRQKYPEEMTIVLRHQFWELEAHPNAFQVTLSFNAAKERLRVPYLAVTRFLDPSLPFGLQFDPPAAPDAPHEPEPDEDAAPGASVVRLDAFRKK